MVDIPDPVTSGSAGTQQAMSTAVVPAVVNPFPAHNMSEAVIGLATTRARSFGGEATATLLIGYAATMQQDVQEGRRDLATTREELRNATTELNNLRVELATVREQVAGAQGIRKMQALALVVGTGLASIAADLYKGNLETLGLLLGVTAAALILVGWFWPMRDAK